MDWQEEPATQQQLLMLQEYGFVPTLNLTVTQAARLIRQYRKHPPRSGAPAATAGPTAGTPPPPSAVRALAADTHGMPLDESARVHAFRLHTLVEAARRALAENPSRPGVRADVHSAVGARQRFWLDTCREGRDLQAASPQALEFYQHFGARFFTPTWEEVGEVLEALDRAVKDWDKAHPELFYETLKLNFPSLLRHR